MGKLVRSDDAPERVVVVRIAFSNPRFRLSNVEDYDAELINLVSSAGLEMVDFVTRKARQPIAATYMASGGVEHLTEICRKHKPDLLVFGHHFSASQERNLSNATGVQVIDRTALILGVFAKRARSREGKLQVELAQLDHLQSRLIRSWTHLERQRGGIRMRGPGETQLATDRTLLAQRRRVLRQNLKQITAQRHLRRARRRDGTVPVIGLVGYTNAGKSALFQLLTRRETYVKDQLFATLDPTTGRAWMERVGDFLLTDTVGFITQLPDALMRAFQPTLEEALSADLLLNVVDVSDSDCLRKRDYTVEVLASMSDQSVPMITVYNKIDRVGNTRTMEDGVSISAHTGAGIEDLDALIAEKLQENATDGQASPSVSKGNMRDSLKW